jgi:tetratricopeptide (TPR) repeat protein
LREAERRFAQVNEAKARVRGDTVSAYDIAYFQATLDGQLRGNPARGLAMLDAALRGTSPETLPVPRDRSLWVALGYANLDAPDKARALMNARAARLDTLGRREEAILFARLGGFIALAEGKTDSAIGLFRRGDVDADGLPSRNCTACTPLFIGLAFDRADRADSATVYLAEYAEMAGTGRLFIDRFYLAPALFRLGELNESAGDAKRATDYYGRFVDLWQNADPELQPRVAEARRRIDQLNRAAQ